MDPFCIISPSACHTVSLLPYSLRHGVFLPSQNTAAWDNIVSVWAAATDRNLLNKISKVSHETREEEEGEEDKGRGLSLQAE